MASLSIRLSPITDPANNIPGDFGQGKQTSATRHVMPLHLASGNDSVEILALALAPFTAQLLEHDKMTAADKEENDVGRAHAKKQFSKPMSLGIQSGVLRKLGEKIGRAKDQDPALRELGVYISFKTNTTWIQGPIKVGGGTLVTDRGAYNKTVTDYFLDWTANKDLIRGTCAARSGGDLISIVARIQIICSPEYGMTLMKRAEVKPDDPKNACGYSGWNFVVVMKGSATPAEIQANTWAMMYGKMSKKDHSNAFLSKGHRSGIRANGTRNGIRWRTRASFL